MIAVFTESCGLCAWTCRTAWRAACLLYTVVAHAYRRWTGSGLAPTIVGVVSACKAAPIPYWQGARPAAGRAGRPVDVAVGQ